MNPFLCERYTNYNRRSVHVVRTNSSLYRLPIRAFACTSAPISHTPCSTTHTRHTATRPRVGVPRPRRSSRLYRGIHQTTPQVLWDHLWLCAVGLVGEAKRALNRTRTRRRGGARPLGRTMQHLQLIYSLLQVWGAHLGRTARVAVGAPQRTSARAGRCSVIVRAERRRLNSQRDSQKLYFCTPLILVRGCTP